MDTITPLAGARRSGVVPGLQGRGAAALGAVMALFERLAEWQQRATERHALRRLGDRALQDIGLSRADAWREAAKPFWRP